MLQIDLIFCSSKARRILGCHILFINTNMFFFFFQAEDGIRDYDVTGVQTCALPISAVPGPETTLSAPEEVEAEAKAAVAEVEAAPVVEEIGRASCRERV